MFPRSMAAAGLLVVLCLPQQAGADVLVRIDKSRQRMNVSVDGEQRYSWPVSTGRAGYGTPNGRYRPQRLARRWFSRKYYNAPMPYSIFFHGGYAIHGTNHIRRLGGPASHGCVRLHPGHAATLFALVKQQGMSRTRIVVTGSNPVQVAPPSKRRRAEAQARVPERRPQRRSYPRRPYYAPGYREPYVVYVPRTYYYEYRPPFDPFW